MSDHLLRGLAPVSDAAWAAIEADAKARLSAQLAARTLVDFVGPLGWEHSSTSLGRAIELRAPSNELTTVQRSVLPVVEVRAEFAVSRSELADADRGAQDIDLDALDRAARAIAVAENGAVFHGYPAAGITGVTEASSHTPIAVEPDVGKYPVAVARAVDALRQSGIAGPYALAIAPDIYTEIVETTEHGGYPLFDHLRAILGGEVVWAPGVRVGVVLSRRGGDFVFECGEDISIGYAGHDDDAVNLYFEESYTFRVLERAAAIALQRAE